MFVERIGNLNAGEGLGRFWRSFWIDCKRKVGIFIAIALESCIHSSSVVRLKPYDLLSKTKSLNKFLVVARGKRNAKNLHLGKLQGLGRCSPEPIETLPGPLSKLSDIPDSDTRERLAPSHVWLVLTLDAPLGVLACSDRRLSTLKSISNCVSKLRALPLFHRYTLTMFWSSPISTFSPSAICNGDMVTTKLRGPPRQFRVQLSSTWSPWGRYACYQISASVYK